MRRLFAQELITFTIGWIAACFLHPAPDGARAIALIGLFGIGGLWRLRGTLHPGVVLAAGFLTCTLLAGVMPRPDGLGPHLVNGRTDLLVTGELVDGPRHGTDGAGFEMVIESVDHEAVTPTRVRVWSPHRSEARAGDEVELFARCGRFGPREFPHLPSSDERWSRRGFAARCTALEPFELLSRRASIRGLLTDRRLQIEATVAAMSQPSRGIATAMLTGTRGYVSEEARAAFRDTGTGHLLAISGLHFGMLAALVWAVVGLVLRRSLRIARGPGVRRVSALVVAPTMAAYLLVVGAPTSASRAWVVVVLVSAGLVLLRRPSGFAALSVAAVLLTVGEPTMVRDLGFQLSFAATTAIVGFWWRRPRLVDFDPYAWERSNLTDRLRRVGAFVLMSCCATAVTWPLLLGATGRISIVAIVLNPVVVPWIGGVVFPLLVATALVASALPFATPLLGVPEALLQATVCFLQVAADLPGATWCPGVPPAPFVSLTLFTVLAVIAARMRPGALAAGGLAIASMVTHLAFVEPPAALRVHFIPVGQGDATLVEFPDGRRVLFDAGGSRYGRDPGRAVVVPYLWRRGIPRLDALVVTHDDVDHAGGVPGVIAEIDVGQVIRDPSPLGVPGVEVRRLVEQGSSNDRSIVAVVRQLRTTVLLTGDIERRGEASWLRTPERVTVLKVPHHGSRTSSTPGFLDAARPVIAVVSAGRHNRFGHPHPHIVRRYQSRGIRLFSTARHGLVLVEVAAGGTITVTTAR